MLAPVLTLAMMQAKQGDTQYLSNACRAAIRMFDSKGGTDPRDLPSLNYCIGYVTGFVDGIGPASQGACVPRSATAEQLIRAFVAYTDKHPNEADVDARLTLRFALADAYPCSK